MSADLAVLSDSIQKASSYIDVFGSDPDQLHANYRKMARILHPDGKNSIDQQLASDAFVLLQSFYDKAKQALAQGSYGAVPVVVITSRKGEYNLIDAPWQGNIAQLYEAVTSTDDSVVVKITRNAKDNDLLQAEAQALKKLHSPDQPDDFKAYFPTIIDHFQYDDRRANVLPYYFKDSWHTFEQVRAVFGANLNPLDAAWMWRRLLVALGAAHEAGVIHCAVTPDHVIIQPELHGLVLLDWCYSRAPGEKPVAMDSKLAEFYPQEFANKEEIGPGTDIYMAAKTMLYLNGDNMPRPLRAFLRGCMFERQKTRPQKAFDLLQEYDELLERLGRPYHPRRFREFKMPN